MFTASSGIAPANDTTVGTPTAMDSAKAKQ